MIECILCSREDEDDIVDAEIVDLEKRKELRKYYVCKHARCFNIDVD